MYLYLADVSVLLVGVSQDITLGIASPRPLNSTEVREAMEKKLRAKFGEAMREWRVRWEIASVEDNVEITIILVLGGIHPSNVVGDHPHPVGRY